MLPNRIIASVFMCAILFPSLAAANFWQALWGKPAGNAVQVGNAVVHLYDLWSDSRDHTLFPYLGVTYHSLHAAYFRNTFNRNSVSASVQRDWYAKRFANNTQLNLGYRIGLIYGYCITGLSCKHKSLPVVPAVQFLMDYTYKRVGFELTYVGVVLTGGLVLRLD